MAEKLKSMMENLDHFVDILTLCYTVYVKDWSVLNVQRALEWGSYFNQVYLRFMDNRPIRNAIEDHLAMKNGELRVQLKNYKDITFEDLGNSKAIICMALLHNNSVSTFVFKHLVERLQGSEEVDSLCLDHMLTQKAASHLFLSLPLITCERSQPLDDPVLVTQADILGSSLQKRIKKLEDEFKLSTVSGVLCKLPQPRVYHLIATLLSVDSVSAKHQHQLHNIILDWLMSSDATWAEFCNNVKHQVLAKLSSKFFKFRQTYLDYLVKLGHGMEQDITGTWACNNPKLSFHEFLEYFRCLLIGPEDLKEYMLTRLQTLKHQDGDYEVSCISIWTDILTELHK